MRQTDERTLAICAALLALAAPIASWGQSLPARDVEASETPGAPSVDGAYEPAAGAETTGARTPLTLLVFGQVFASHLSRWADTDTPSPESSHAFELRRAEAGIGFEHRARAGAILNMEAIRSAGPQSLFGVDNDSMVLRIKHAFVHAAPETGPVAWVVRAGLIADPWVEVVENRYDLRGVSPLLAEDGRFFDTSDLGVMVAAELWSGAVSARVSLTNGEGRNQRELNNGKNTTAALSVDPLRLWGITPATLEVSVGYRDGSTGFSAQADGRWMAAVTGRWDLLFVGGEYVRAAGHGGRGAVDAQGFGAWINGAWRPRWLGALVQVHRWQPDLAVDGHHQRWLTGIYADLIEDDGGPRSVLGFPRARVYLTYEQFDVEGAAAPVVGHPAMSATQAVMVTVSARGAVVR